MKSNTEVHLAIRNIGNAQDQGKLFSGFLNEVILQLAKELSTMTMAGRIVIGIGRNEADAMRGIDVKNAGKSAVTSDMEQMLAKIFDGDSDGLTVTNPNATQIDGDDYVA